MCEKCGNVNAINSPSKSSPNRDNGRLCVCINAGLQPSMALVKLSKPQLAGGIGEHGVPPLLYLPPISKSSNVFNFIAPDNNGFVYVLYDELVLKPKLNDVNPLAPTPVTVDNGFVFKFSPVVPKPEVPNTLDKPLVPNTLLKPAVADVPTVGNVYDDATGAPLNPNV